MTWAPKYNRKEDTMEERKKGHCPHGEFYLDEGCPQCIAEARAKRPKAVGNG